MEPLLQAHLRSAFAAQASRWRGRSPLFAALCAGLGAGPSPAAGAIFDRFFRIISATHANVPLFLGALHALALSGGAPRLASFFPSCGGSFAEADAPALLAAAEADLEAGREEMLDFMLSREPHEEALESCALLMLGALATVERFGGGLSLVDPGCGGGSRLLLDRYGYRFGSQVLGDSSLSFTVSGAEPGALARLAAGGMPRVIARRGLDLAPLDLTDPGDLLAAKAFLAPDQTGRLERLEQAAALQAEGGRPDLRQGDVTWTLGPLLVEAYNEMDPGNTLLILQAMHWVRLSEEERKRMATAIQTLAAQIQPHKPIAWIQAEPFTPGSPALELRLHTFGWADPEDRAVRKVATADPQVSTITWLE